MTAKCVVCSRPVGDGAMLDARCEGALTISLAECPALAEELELTITRQTAMGARNGSRSAEKPLPVNMDASEVTYNLTNTLVGWIRDLEPDVAYQPANNLTSMSSWLLRHMDTIRVHKAADEMHDEITYAIREAWRCIDRPANRSRVKVADCLDDSCCGELIAYFPIADYEADDDTTHAKITCTECPVVYPADQWLHVGRRVLAMRRAS